MVASVPHLRLVPSTTPLPTPHVTIERGRWAHTGEWAFLVSLVEADGSLIMWDGTSHEAAVKEAAEPAAGVGPRVPVLDLAEAA